jgi:hypothetical protein
MLVIALVAICAGVWHELPGLGIVLAVAATPALLYTSIMAFKGAARGRPMDTIEKVGSFIGALAGVVVISLSALIAFGMTCFPVGLVAASAGPPGFIVAFAVGGVAGLAAAAFVARALLIRAGRRAR